MKNILILLLLISFNSSIFAQKEVTMVFDTLHNVTNLTDAHDFSKGAKIASKITLFHNNTYTIKYEVEGVDTIYIDVFDIVTKEKDTLDEHIILYGLSPNGSYVTTIIFSDVSLGILTIYPTAKFNFTNSNY